MNVHFTDDGWDEYRHWVRTDLEMLRRINALIEDARRRGFTGLGKPEPLKGALAGWWSRRISGEHRLVYRVERKAGQDQRIVIAACRYHHGR